MKALVLIAVLPALALAQSSSATAPTCALVESVEGQVCYLRCGGRQTLNGSLVVSGSSACIVSNGASEAMLSIDSTQTARGINFDSSTCGGNLANPSLYWSSGTQTLYALATNGLDLPSGTIRARSANAGISIGSAGSEVFGIAAGGLTINVTGALANQYGAMAGVSGTTAGTQFLIGGAFSVNTTAVGNSGACGTLDLQTYSLGAHSINTTTRCVKAKAWGTTANNANAKTVRLTIGPGPTALITKQLTASIAGRWKLEATICRTGASAQDYFSEAVNYGGTTVSSTDGATVALLSGFGSITETETNALTIKTQATVCTTANDIVSEGLVVEYL